MPPVLTGEGFFLLLFLFFCMVGYGAAGLYQDWKDKQHKGPPDYPWD